jgi:hypothetical protein
MTTTSTTVETVVVHVSALGPGSVTPQFVSSSIASWTPPL